MDFRDSHDRVNIFNLGMHLQGVWRSKKFCLWDGTGIGAGKYGCISLHAHFHTFTRLVEHVSI